MPRQAKGLRSDVAIRALKRPGYHCDGGGLYLQVTATGARSWIYRYANADRRHEMGLGPYPGVTLKAAREKAAELRVLRAAGKDPLDERRTMLASKRSSVTFREAAEAYIAAHAPSWRNAKHGDQWRNTLAAYAYPVLGDLSVAEIDTGLVLKVLEPIWTVKTETAKRVRGRIECVLDWAAARKYRAGENPARWRGHLDKLLARPTKVRTVRHHAALPYAEIPAFMAALAAQDGIAPKALAFCILTATRTSEAVGARWAEIDGTTWTIPGDRMKSGREHRVPLAEAAQVIVDDMRRLRGDRDHFVFPGGRPGKPLSNMALLAVLRRMHRAEITVHGFRSAFRDWCGEQTNFPREVAEAALAHIVRDKTERAYARGDMLSKRAQLMEAWARFCLTPGSTGTVVPIGRGMGIAPNLTT